MRAVVAVTVMHVLVVCVACVCAVRGEGARVTTMLVWAPGDVWLR